MSKSPRDGLLFDGQWINIVNANNCWRDYDPEAAVHEAVRMTLEAVRSNGSAILATLIAELGQEVGAVEDERLCDFFAHVGEVEQFMDDLCNVVTELTGDEGEDDPITVLRRYIASSPAHTSEARDAVSMIAAQRRRQVDVEGWTREHDDGHTFGEIARAAALYCLPADCRKELELSDIDLPFGWIKPGERIRELTKAGALIVAEIDRLQRKESSHD